tara:strand:- start:9 stop:302 length:294 start_codon:yes stop_codon:yes gene_type:complete
LYLENKIENNDRNNRWRKKQKLKFDDSEYFLDDLLKEAKQLVMGLRTADAQTKMYEDTLKLIALGKNKMVKDLKIILDQIEPIQLMLQMEETRLLYL